MLELPDDPRILSYLVAAAMVLDLTDRQLLLEAATTTDRLRREVALLGRETMLVRQVPSLPAIDLARTPSGSELTRGRSSRPRCARIGGWRRGVPAAARPRPWR